MKSHPQHVWIEAGYELFAREGPAGLKVEPLARKVGKNKSSFYHHFADAEVFTAQLLAMHLERSGIMAEKEHAAARLDPDFIHILVGHRLDLLFNRQLRIHRSDPRFYDTLCRSAEIVGDVFRSAWLREVNPAMEPHQLEALYALAVENFFLQINEENLHFEWLSAYFSSLKEKARHFGSTPLLRLDGSV